MIYLFIHSATIENLPYARHSAKALEYTRVQVQHGSQHHEVYNPAKTVIT